MSSVELSPESVDAHRKQRSGTLSGSLSLNALVKTLLLECSSKEELLIRVPQICSSRFGSSVERFVLRIGESFETRLTYHDRMERVRAEGFDRDLLAPIADAVQSANIPEPRLKQLRQGEQSFTLISVPVLNVGGDQVEGSITLLIGGQPQPEVLLLRLDGVAAVVTAALCMLPGADHEQTSDRGKPTRSHTSTQHESAPSDCQTSLFQQHRALGRVSQFESTKEFAYSIVDALRNQVHAEQVFFGVERRQQIKVEAVSGLADFKSSSPAVAAVQQAMEECIDAAAPIVSQTHKLSSVDSLPIHQRWSVECNNASVCSVPLRQDQQTTGVISIVRSADRPFTADEVTRIEQSVGQYGPAVTLIEQATSPVTRRITCAVSDSLRKTVSQGITARICMLALAAAGLLWFLLGTVTYRPLCAAKVSAADLRHVTAPFDGQLLSVHVYPGQQVAAGQLMLEFDTSALRLERNRLQREMSTSEVRLRQAISQDDISLATLTRSQMNVLSTQLSAVRRKIEESRIIAPKNGTVILSDLERRIGQNFSHGDEMLQFAAGHDWLLEIEIPDDIVHYVGAEQSGTFAAASRPTDKQTFLIQHVDGGATTRQDRNIFVARATLETYPRWMRSGMEGTAQIKSVARPVWWVALHRMIDWARTGFWI